MKFDLFDAMNIMKKNFGNSGSIRLSNDNYGVFVTLEVYKNGVLYNDGFLIENNQIVNDRDVGLSNLMFDKVVKNLREIWENDR